MNSLNKFKAISSILIIAQRVSLKIHEMNFSKFNGVSQAQTTASLPDWVTGDVYI